MKSNVERGLEELSNSLGKKNTDPVAAAIVIAAGMLVDSLDNSLLCSSTAGGLADVMREGLGGGISNPVMSIPEALCNIKTSLEGMDFVGDPE